MVSRPEEWIEVFVANHTTWYELPVNDSSYSFFAEFHFIGSVEEEL